MLDTEHHKATVCIENLKAVAVDNQCSVVQFSVVQNEIYRWIINSEGDIHFRCVDVSEVLEPRTQLTAFVQRCRNQLIKGHTDHEELGQLGQLLMGDLHLIDKTLVII